MVCRENPLSSVFTTFARDMTGLEDNQVLGLNHALMQEGIHAPDDQETWDAFVDQALADFDAGRLRAGPRSRGVRRRILEARDRAPDGSRLYAARELLARSQRARDAQAGYFRSYAREFGVSESHSATEFWVGFQDASDDARLTASPAFERAWLSNPDNTDLMVDRRSLYAYEQMEIARAARVLQQDARPAVQSREPVDSAAIAEIGYDSQGGRLEVVMRSNPDRVYAYRMSPTEYAEFRSAPSLGSFFARRIRGNDAYAYGSQAEADQASEHRRCATCGEFASMAYHDCPPTGSAEDINRDIRLAVVNARARAAGVAGPPAAPPTPRLAPVRTVRYLTEAGAEQSSSIRIPGVTRVTQEARRETSVQIPVRASLDDDQGHAEVVGYAVVAYNGRGQGYQVSAVTEPGDSGTDKLRCTCARYRATYHCEHVDAVIGQIQALANGSSRAGRAQAQSAASAVSADLASEYDASVTATDAAIAGWRPLETSFVDNPEEFQSVYDGYRDHWTAYKESLARGEDPKDLPYPVPYLHENAFGGLADRGGPRSFGTEIEFSLPPNTTEEERAQVIAAIGQELYDLGLTRSPEQEEYGASHGDYRDYHERGWSFEEDGSTGVWPGSYRSQDSPVLGGEIVAPIMFDERKTWENIAKVCDVLKRHGAVVSAQSGLHVHVGVGDYDHRVDNHNRLLEAVSANEDLLYRMSTNPERGQHRGRNYCEPNQVAASPYTTVGDARRYHNGHHLAINMQSVSGVDNDHVEFRTFDSSLNPAVIQAQIGMAIYLAEGATRPESTGGQTRTPLGSRVRQNPGRSRTSGQDWQESTKGFRTFLDRFVPGQGGDEKENPRVQQMIALFAITRWQRLRDSESFS